MRPDHGKAFLKALRDITKWNTYLDFKAKSQVMYGARNSNHSNEPTEDNIWPQIKPLLQEAWTHAVAANKSPQEFVQIALGQLDEAGIPYLERYVREEIDCQTGSQSKTHPQLAVENTSMFDDDNDLVQHIMSKHEIQALKRLLQLITTLRVHIESGEGLMGLGAAILALEELVEEKHFPDENWPFGLVSVRVGFDQGTRDFNEGHHYDMEISPEGLELDYLYRCYSSDYGSDHHTESMVEFYPGSSLSINALDEWLSKVEELLKMDKATVSASIDMY